MERKLTVSKTKVFVPKLVGTKICLSALSSASTLVPRWKIPPPPPSILACHLVLKHFCRWSWLTDLGWLYDEKVALMFDHSHSITSSADVPSPSFPPKPHLPPHLSSFFCVSTHFPSQFTLDAFDPLILAVYHSINSHKFHADLWHSHATKALWSFTLVDGRHCTFSKGADRLFVLLQKVLCMFTSLAHHSKPFTTNPSWQWCSFKAVIMCASKVCRFCPPSVACLCLDPVLVKEPAQKARLTHLWKYETGDKDEVCDIVVLSCPGKKHFCCQQNTSQMCHRKFWVSI